MVKNALIEKKESACGCRAAVKKRNFYSKNDFVSQNSLIEQKKKAPAAVGRHKKSAIWVQKNIYMVQNALIEKKRKKKRLRQ